MRDAERLDSLETDGSAARVSLFADSRSLCIGLDFEEQARADGLSVCSGYRRGRTRLPRRPGCRRGMYSRSCKALPEKA